MSREMKSNNIAVSWKILFSFWHVQPCIHQSSFEMWVYNKNELDSDFSSISWRPGVQLYNQITFFSWFLNCSPTHLNVSQCDLEPEWTLIIPGLKSPLYILVGSFVEVYLILKKNIIPGSEMKDVSHCLKPLPNLQEVPFQRLVFMWPCLKRVKGHCIKCLDVSCSMGFNWTIYLYIYMWLTPGGMQNSYYIRRQ